jgi:hypothetical protein
MLLSHCQLGVVETALARQHAVFQHQSQGVVELLGTFVEITLHGDDPRPFRIPELLHRKKFISFGFINFY